MTLEERTDNLNQVLLRHEADFREIEAKAEQFRYKKYSRDVTGYDERAWDIDEFLAMLSFQILSIANTLSRMQSGEYSAPMFELLGLKRNDIYTKFTNWIEYLKIVSIATSNRVKVADPTTRYFTDKARNADTLELQRELLNLEGDEVSEDDDEDEGDDEG